MEPPRPCIQHRRRQRKFVGYNYRMTNLQAAIGLAQTEQLERFVEMRRASAAYYAPLQLRRGPGIVTPPRRAR